MKTHHPLALTILAALGAAAAGIPSEDPPLPQTFTANLLIVNASRSGTARLRMTVDRWSTDEERQQLFLALQEGGTTELVSAMERLTVGYLQVDSNLRWPIRIATTFETSEGRVVRLATNRPISFEESIGRTRSLDYPIGVIQFALPPDGPGEGTLSAATKVRFTEDRKIEITSMPQNTGPQRLTGVRLETPRSKKKGKDREKEGAGSDG